MSNARIEERLPLLPREETESAAVAMTTFNRCMAIAAPPGLLKAMSYPALAWPAFYENFDPVSKYLSLPLCAGNLVLDVMADREFPNAVAVKSKVSHAETGLNTFNFFLGLYIATYVAAYAAVNKIGENEVDTPDSAYLLGFVAPSAMVGVAHVYLDANKASWQERVTYKQKFLDSAHSLVSTLYNAGTLNEIMLLALSAWDIGESGKMDPNLRLGLFSLALTAGFGLHMLSRNKAWAVKPVKYAINATTAANYISEYFVEREGHAPDNTLRAVAGATFVTLGVAALISAVIYPEVKEVRLAPEPDLAPEPARDVSLRALSVSTEFYSASSPRFFSCNSGAPSRVASAPDLTVVERDEERVERRRSSSF